MAGSLAIIVVVSLHILHAEARRWDYVASGFGLALVLPLLSLPFAYAIPRLIYFRSHRRELADKDQG